MDKVVFTDTAAETEALAADLAENLPPDISVIALFGDMGAGKTAFTRGFMAGLKYGGVVSSPTYAIVNEYLSPRGAVFHFDWYRLSGEAELYDLGWDEYLERGLCIVEWSERAPEVLPPERTLIIEISTSEDASEVCRLEREPSRRREVRLRRL
ncbi:hypothetical protein FACS1894217_02420 [Clostridia bacterium]|nr:hypothetical protein FACS1894217_02420 [Clostridia bacterium]